MGLRGQLQLVTVNLTINVNMCDHCVIARWNNDVDNEVAAKSEWDAPGLAARYVTPLQITNAAVYPALRDKY